MLSFIIEKVVYYIISVRYNLCSISFSAFATRLFSVLRFESVIHEFDPYFNYRTTRFLTEEGFYKFHNWFDDRAWYPLGRIIGGKFCHVFISVLLFTKNQFFFSKFCK